MEKSTIRRSSLAEIDARVSNGEGLTRPDAPEAPAEDDAFWASAVVVNRRERKASVHLRIDSEVLDWFKSQGVGHLTRMNSVLRAYYEAQHQKVAKE